MPSPIGSDLQPGVAPAALVVRRFAVRFVEVDYTSPKFGPERTGKESG